MAPSTLTTLAMPISFLSLMALMLAYWYQAAIFSYIRYKKITYSLLFVSIFLLTCILIIRWIESKHFPLSNLYESLVFLSWSFLISQLLLQHNNKLFSPIAIIRDGKNMPLIETDSLGKKGTNPPHERMTATHLFKERMIPSPFTERMNQRAPTDHKIISFERNPNDKDTVDFTSMIGVVLSPMALLTYGFAFLKLPKELQQATTLVPALQSNWLMMHVTIMVLSYAALICGSILSMAFLLVTRLASCSPAEEQPQLSSWAAPQNRTISHVSNEDGIKHSSTQPNETRDRLNKSIHLTKKPPLEEGSINSLSSLHLANKLDNLSYRLLGLGFPLLTIGILSGAVWANEAWGSYWSWDPKETWAFITWLVFAIYLHARITKGWSGQRPAVIATVGFFVVWFCYLGVNLLGTGLHSYGWFSRLV